MTMNICFATDDNYARPTAVAIMTVLVSNPESDFDIYIITQSLTEKSKDILKSVTEKYSNGKARIFFSTLNDSIVNDFSQTLKKEDHVSLATYLRLFIPTLLPSSVSKILYLDGDIICAESLAEFYSTDLQGFSMAAAHDERTEDDESFSRLNYPKENGYAAAGVLLINVDWWRRNNVQEKTLEYVGKHKDLCKWHDQDALNKILNGTILFCHIKYNAYEFLFENENNYPRAFDGEVKEATENPVVIHFCSGRKPWTKELRCPFTSTWQKLYKVIFGKNCRLVHRYKGKIRFEWSIKRILNKLGIKKYDEFNPRHEYDGLKNRIESRLLGNYND